jgi:ribosomal-protein-alanine N-acetyltransferase
VESVTLQKAMKEDIEVLLRLEHSVAGTRLYSPILDRDEMLQEIEEYEMYLIKSGENIVGTISYESKSADCAHIGGLVVDPLYQGKGIARHALGMVLDMVGTGQRIEIVTHPENTRALNLYQSLGFVIESRTENYYADGEPRARLVKKS